MEKFGIESKRLMADEIKERLKKAPSPLFIASFSAIGVSEQQELRRKLKEINASLFVVKNRIAKAVFSQLNQEVLTGLMQGPTAITFGSCDCLSVSKVLVDFAGKHESFKIMGAYVDEYILDLSTVRRLASIPSKEVLLAQIVCGIRSPIQGLLNTLSATIKKFVVVIGKIKEKQGRG